jgi:acyl-CoA synthetase (AMP-forming)/AMP-acid ligase II
MQICKLTTVVNHCVGSSGSTGQPKGVMLAHSALTAAVAGIFHHCKATFIPGAFRAVYYG